MGSSIRARGQVTPPGHQTRRRRLPPRDEHCKKASGIHNFTGVGQKLARMAPQQCTRHFAQNALRTLAFYTYASIRAQSHGTGVLNLGPNMQTHKFRSYQTTGNTIFEIRATQP